MRRTLLLAAALLFPGFAAIANAQTNHAPDIGFVALRWVYLKLDTLNEFFVPISDPDGDVLTVTAFTDHPSRTSYPTLTKVSGGYKLSLTPVDDEGTHYLTLRASDGRKTTEYVLQLLLTDACRERRGSVFNQEHGPDTAANNMLNVESFPGCAWTASTAAPWITLNAASGVGSSPVSYSVAANLTGAPRSAVITVDFGEDQIQDYTVTQSTDVTISRFAPMVLQDEDVGFNTSIAVPFTISPWSSDFQVSAWAGGVVLNASVGGTSTQKTLYLSGFLSSNGNASATIAVYRSGTATLVAQADAFLIKLAVKHAPEILPLPNVTIKGGETLEVPIIVRDDDPGHCGCPGTRELPTVTFSSSNESIVLATPLIAPLQADWQVGDGYLRHPWILRRNVSPLVTGNTIITVSATDGIHTTTSSFTVTVQCGVVLSPTIAAIAAAGGSGDVTLLTAPSCTWTGASSAPWLTFTPASGTGSTTVGYSGAATNVRVQRSATITAGNATFNAVQTAGVDAFALSRTSLNVRNGATSESVDLTSALVDSPWTATTDASWLHLSPASGVGSSAVGVAIDRNVTTAARTATVVIAGMTVTVNQQGNATPARPFALAAAASAQRVQFGWQVAPVGGMPTSYILEIGRAPGASDLGQVTTPTGATTFEVQGLPSGRYYWRVRGVNEIGSGLPSADEELIIASDGSSRSGAPSGLRATVANGIVTLAWQAPTSGGVPTSYVISVGSGPGRDNVLSFDTRSTALTISAPVPAGVLYVRVRARNAAGDSAASNEVTVGTQTPPAPPTGVASTVTGSSVTLSWTGTASSYLLEVGRSPMTTFVTLPVAGLSFTQANVPSGVYYVRVRAVSAQGTSGTSNEVIVYVP